MQNGPNTMTNTHRPKSARPFANRSKQWTSNVARPDLRGPQSAQRSYERYLALAQAQAQSGDVIGAENYYQHAEHYFRSMSSERETT
jgi:Domain of unknown function (DUF4167)